MAGIGFEQHLENSNGDEKVTANYGLVSAGYCHRRVILSAIRVSGGGNDGGIFDIGVFQRQVLVLELMPARRFLGYGDVKGEPEKAPARNFSQRMVPLAGIHFIHQLPCLSDYQGRREHNCHRRGFCGNVHINNRDFHDFGSYSQASELVRDLPDGNAAG